MIYDTHRDLCMRLKGTVVVYDKKACVVDECTEELKLRLVRLNDMKQFEVGQTDKKLDIRGAKLGYVNTPRGALYLTRSPDRQYKQGINPRALSVRGVGVRAGIAGVDMTHLTQCIENTYPTVKQAMKKLEGGGNPFKQEKIRSIAISRRWAVGGGNTLWYKGKQVGEFGDRPMLDDNHKWLVEDLEETLHG